MIFISYLPVAPEAGVRVGVVRLVDGLLPELVLAACNLGTTESWLHRRLRDYRSKKLDIQCSG